MRKFIIIVITFLSLNSSLLILNSGAQWVQMSNGMGNDTTVVAFAENANNIFAATKHGVYVSTNYGANWTQTSLNYTSVSSIAISGNNIYAGGNNPWGFYYSTNNGNNWTQTSINEFSIQTIALIGNTILVGSGMGLYRSTNYGYNWTLTDLEFGTTFSILAIGNNIFAGNQVGLYRSTNDGLNWSLFGLNGKIVYSLTTIGNVFYAGTFNYGVYKSIDTGTTWTLTTLNNQNAISIVGNSSNIFVGTINNGVFLSTDSGTNWIQKNQGFTMIPTVIKLFLSNSYIFAGTYNNYIWRRSLSEIIGIQNISTETPPKYSLSQNYPNPFNPTTRIRFNVALDSRLRGNDKVVLKVYDVMGREVQTLVNERLQPGTYEASFNGSMLNSGMYFYKLVTDGFTETKKMMLIK